MNRRTLIAASVVGLIATIMLWPEDQPPEPPKKTTETGIRSEPAARPGPETQFEHRFRPLEPGYEDRDGRYGSSGPQPEPYRASPPGSPYYGYPERGVTPYAPVEPPRDPTERFSFRPLSDRERERLEADRPDAYYVQAPVPVPQPYVESGRQPAPSGYGQPPAYPDWYGDGYSYRGYGGYPPDRDGRRSPYRDRRGSSDYQDAWPAPPEPQWGSQPRDWAPPAQRMFPSLDAEQGRRFTSR